MSMYGALYRNILFPVWETWLHGRRTPKYLKELTRTQWLPPDELKKEITGLTRQMRQAAQELRFEDAAQLRDRIKELEELQIAFG